MQGTMRLRGKMGLKVTRADRAPLGWRVRNTLRWGFLWGWFCYHLARLFSRLTGVPTITSRLLIRVFQGGRWVDYGVVGYREITDVGVAFLVDDWHDSTTDITTMAYHGCGTDNTAEDQTDTALGAESTTALNPDSTRATGTPSQPSANVLQSVGTLTFDNTAAVVEHGLFSTSGTGTGVLWDRTVFTVINVGSGDSIQFTYQCTLTAGG